MQCPGRRQSPSGFEHRRDQALQRYLGDNACSADDRVDGICFGADSESAQALSSEAGQKYWKNQRRCLLFCRRPNRLQ